MLGKKLGLVKRLANKIRVRGCTNHGLEKLHNEYLLVHDRSNKQGSGSCTSTPRGCTALYVGEERRRFVVHTSRLSHPLFKMLLEKAAEEFGFDQKDRLLVPCSVAVFRAVLSAVECNNGKFELGHLVEEFN